MKHYCNVLTTDFSIRLLSATEDTSYQKSPSEQNNLKEFSINSQSSFNERWKQVAVSLVRWARQELRQDEYENLHKKLLRKFPNDQHLNDELTHENVLLALYKGDRDVAQNILINWEIRSPDGYMHVRKGMLLGEVGDVPIGLTTSLVGLKKIRKNQRSRTSSIRYLSQEAWACLAISYLQKSLAWSINFTKKGREFSSEINPDELNQRLADLASIDHDVVHELQLIMADLSAETPAPSQPISRTPLFEVGSYSTTRHIGKSNAFEKKTTAAFVWLSLSDRVSLVPRVGDTTFDIGAFAQAAWWVQYVDSMERVLSVMIRTLNKKMLEPRSDSQLIHSAGWLSRYQVARVKESLANSICEQSLSLVERFFESVNNDDEVSRITNFHLELVGRLVIRLTDSEVVYSFGERIIALHHSKVAGRHSEIWKSLAVCLARCFENSNLIDRGRLAISIVTIPSATQDESTRKHYQNNWIIHHNFKKRSNDPLIDYIPAEASKNIDELILTLKGARDNDTDQHSSQTGTWVKLFWLKEWGFINESQTHEISLYLSNHGGWPVLPGYHSWASLQWMSNLKKTQDTAFRKWLLNQKIKPFRIIPEDNSIKPDGRISWRMGADDSFFINMSASLKRSKWPASDFTKSLLIVKAWWDDEWLLITRNINRIDDLVSMAQDRLINLDIIIARFIDTHGHDSFINSEIYPWASTVRTESSVVNTAFLHTRLSEYFSKAKDNNSRELETELISELLCTDVSRINKSVDVIWHWIEHPKSSKFSPPDGLISTLIAIIATRRTPALFRVMNLMAKLIVLHPNWLCNSAYILLDNGLNMMLEELRYENRPDGTGIPDEVVPELRLGCLKLAKAIGSTSHHNSRATIDLWEIEARSDPLPELRYYN